MRFEEVSPPVEHRLIVLVVQHLRGLADEAHQLVNFTTDDVTASLESIRLVNTSAAAAKALRPGGLASVLFLLGVAASLLRFLIATSFKNRMLRAVKALANAASVSQERPHVD